MVDDTIHTSGLSDQEPRLSKLTFSQNDFRDRLRQHLGQQLPDSEKDQASSFSLDELRTRYPTAYKHYLSTLSLGKQHIPLVAEVLPTTYSPEEYTQICNAIGKGISISKEVRDKLAMDIYFQKYPSQAIFFPEIYERIYQKNEKPQIFTLPAWTRGATVKIDFPDMSYVVKPLESTAESVISHKAGELNIGPKEYASLDWHLTEEFIQGTPFLELNSKDCTPEYMKDLGRQFGHALKVLHDNNILYNDQLLTNPDGKSHIIIDTSGKLRFIDFGASIDLTHFPDISDEEVISLIRTDPMAQLSWGGICYMKEGEEKQQRIKAMIVYYRDNILSKISKRDLIIMKDYSLMQEGLSYLSSRLPNVDAFYQGIKEVF